MEKTDIYITQGKDYCEMTRELLEACDLASDIGDRKACPLFKTYRM